MIFFDRNSQICLPRFLAVDLTYANVFHNFAFDRRLSFLSPISRLVRAVEPLGRSIYLMGL